MDSSITLADIVEITHGFAFKGEYFSDTETIDVCMTPGNFLVGGGFKSDKFKYYDGPVDSKYLLDSGDLVVTMTDLSKETDTLGFPAIVPSGNKHRFLHNQRIGKVFVRREELLDKKYLYYLLCTASYRNEIVASATGTTVKHTSPTKILAYSARLPDCLLYTSPSPRDS